MSNKLKCPYCGSKKIEQDGWHGDLEDATARVVCTDCDDDFYINYEPTLIVGRSGNIPVKTNR